MISLVNRVRGQTRLLTRDIVSPPDKPIVRVSKQAPVAVKAEEQHAAGGDGGIGNDEEMGADYEMPGKDDVQIAQVDGDDCHHGSGLGGGDVAHSSGVSGGA